MRFVMATISMFWFVVPVWAGTDIEGIWAYNPAWCANVNLIGEAEQTPIRITSDGILGLENYCEIKGRSEAGDALMLDLACAGEGSEYKDTALLLTVSGNLVRFYPDSFSARVFTRCKE